MNKETIEAYWKKFLSTLPADSPYHTKNYSEGGYGDSPELMDELIQLVLEGKKTATCGALWEYEAEGESIPKVGDVWVELDGNDNPVCITETVEVTLRNYNEVGAEFAQDEGEGDQSLEYWREAHRDFFLRTLPKIGKEFSEEMPLVCERFKVICKHI
jgi:uncharacterized protein YhfF